MRRVFFVGIVTIAVALACGDSGKVSDADIETAIARTQAAEEDEAESEEEAEEDEEPTATEEMEEEEEVEEAAEGTPTEEQTEPSADELMLTATAASEAGEMATVTRVIDGDTIEVEVGGEKQRVRYIGVDSPEQNVTCAAEATEANAELVEDQTVIMVKDVSEIDQFGRLLRYVYVGDTFVNAKLVEDGYAIAAQYPPDVAHADDFSNLELLAEANDRGCHPTGVFETFAVSSGASGGGAPTQQVASTLPPAPTSAPPTSAPLPTQAPPPTNTSAPAQAQNPWPGCPEITCPNFSSCSQVYEYLSFCPQYWGRRDGDNDGIPCEVVC